MKAKITKEFLKGIKPKAKPFEIRDMELKGFILRVQPSGVMTFIAQYGRGRRITIGPMSTLKLDDAKKKAREHLANSVLGKDPMEERKAERAFTLESFIAEKYKQWAEANMKHSKEALRKIASFYHDFGKKKLPEITAWGLEKYRSNRLKSGTSASTMNRELDTLRAALNRAVQWGILKTNPMMTVKRSRVDSSASIRYLTPEEDKQLREALEAREAKRRDNRQKFNLWRRERGYKEFPAYAEGGFTDHLKPMVLLALNTGCRRGELFNLAWTDINFVGRMLTVVGKTAKSLQTRHIPLNDEAFNTLQKWYAQRKNSPLIFPSHNGERMDNISTSWERLIGDAKIEHFRFHDCRHDFASKLVMAGVDLNTVRELLGHSDIKMTLRYAHLAPAKLQAAVAKLGVKSSI
jgi:integrase